MDISVLIGLASAGASTLATATGAAKTLQDMLSKEGAPPEYKRNISEIYDSLIAAKVMQARMIDEINNLKNEISRVESFSIESSRYRLVKTPGGPSCTS